MQKKRSKLEFRDLQYGIEIRKDIEKAKIALNEARVRRYEYIDRMVKKPVFKTQIASALGVELHYISECIARLRSFGLEHVKKGAMNANR
jgi:hypothetical protein